MKTPAKAMNVFWDVTLITALMFVLVLGLVYAYLFVTKDLFIDAPVAGLIILPGTAIAAAIGLRAARLGWGKALVSALVFGIAVILFSRFEISPFHSFLWLRMDARLVLDLRTAGIFLVICSAGIFLLPLLDSRVRNGGPAPTLWKVAVSALGLALLSLLIDYLFAHGYLLGLVALILGSIAALGLAVVGVVLALIRFEAIGAWAGGTGLLLEGFITLAWLLLGRPWFP